MRILVHMDANAPDSPDHKTRRNKRENAVPREQRIALDIETAADMLSVSRRHVYDLINEGRIRSTKLGDRRLISRRELERLIEERAGR
jgi:excisionase family DNA binding protein